MPVKPQQLLGGSRPHEEGPTGIPKTKKKKPPSSTRVPFLVSSVFLSTSGSLSLLSFSLAREPSSLEKRSPGVERRQEQPTIPCRPPYPPFILGARGISQAVLRLAATTLALPPLASLLGCYRVPSLGPARPIDLTIAENVADEPGATVRVRPWAARPPAAVAQVRTSCIRWGPRLAPRQSSCIGSIWLAAAAVRF